MQAIPHTSVRSNDVVFADDHEAIFIKGHVVDSLERVVFLLWTVSELRRMDFGASEDERTGAAFQKKRKETNGYTDGQQETKDGAHLCASSIVVKWVGCVRVL
jgi:hypothetical protein